MSIKKWLLRKLAEKEHIDFKYEYGTDDEKKKYDVRQEELRKFEAGEDIDPPWVKYDSTTSPWELRHDYWLLEIWLPFWRGMDDATRQTYRTKWNMPNDWYEVVTMFWGDAGQDKGESGFSEQKREC